MGRKISFDLFTEAIAAVDGTVVTGLERNLAGLAALAANRVEHLPVTAAATGRISLASVAASLAALGLVAEALLGEELLLLNCESELLTAVLAYDCFVLKHGIPLLN